MSRRGEVDTLAPITERLRESLPEWVGRGARLVSSTPRLATFRFSFYLRYPVERPDGATTAIFVKLQRRPGMDSLADALGATESLRAKAQGEYEGLSLLWRIFGDPQQEDFAAVRPLAFIEPCSAVVTEELAGTPVQRLLQRPRLRMRSLPGCRVPEAAFRRVGLWLRTLHEHTGGIRAEPLSVAPLSRDIEEMRAKLDASGASARELRASADVACRLLDELRGSTAPAAVLHRDFHAENILLTPEARIAALDPRLERGPVYEDLSALLTHSPLAKQHQLTHGLLLDRVQMRRLANAVLGAYLGPGGHDPRQLGLFCALGVLARWTHNEVDARAATGVRAVQASMLMARKRRYFERLAAGWLEYARTSGGGGIPVCG